MEIIDYFEDSRQTLWRGQIASADWNAAKYLAKLLENEAVFADYFGTGKLYLLTDGDAIVSFATLSRKDCIPEDDLYPWVGFVYTFPAYRGHRYSEKVIRHAEKVAFEYGCPRIYLTTDHNGLYEKYGYTYLETRTDRFQSTEKIYYKQL